MAQIEELLEEIEEILADGKGKAFSSRATVDVDALKTVIEDIRLSVPEEIKQARILASERREIMNRANREATEILENAREKSRDLLAASEKRAHENDGDTNRRNEELIREAQTKAKSIIDSARIEADRLVDAENIAKEAKIAAARMLSEAKEESENIIRDAKNTSENMIANAEDLMKETKQKSIELLAEAKKRAERIERDAERESRAKIEAAAKWSHDLKMNAGNFVEELVNETEYRIAKSLNEIQRLQGSLTVAAKKSTQPTQAQEKRTEEQHSDKPVQKKKPDNGMTEKHTQNLLRNERDMFGRKRKPLGKSSLIEEDKNVQVIMPKPSIIDIPLGENDLDSMPIVPNEEMF